MQRAQLEKNCFVRWIPFFFGSVGQGTGLDGIVFAGYLEGLRDAGGRRSPKGAVGLTAEPRALQMRCLENLA